MLNKKVKYITKSIIIVLMFSLCIINVPEMYGLSTALAMEDSSGYYLYTVRWGDSLFTIARKYGTTVDSIKKANSLTSDMIYPAQVLKIWTGQQGNTNLYTVKSGDTLYIIALKCGVSVGDLKKSNNLASDIIYPEQILVIPGNSLNIILDKKGINKYSAKFEILVDKTDHVLTLYGNGALLKSYHVELGDNGIGDKEVAGDHKTPEGTFYICEKLVISPSDQYLGSRWMRLSYPNIEDAERGLHQGIIDRQAYSSIVSAVNNSKIPLQRTGLGGGIGIHGGSTPELGKNWTWGCVGLSNYDVEEFYNYVSVGTKVVIQQ